MTPRATPTGTKTVALFLAFVAVACSDDDYSIPPSDTPRYALITWAGRNSELCFALMPIEERADFLRRWFPKRFGRCGLPTLKAALATVPRGVAVMWEDDPKRGFTYPPEPIVQELRAVSEAHGLTVHFTPVLIEHW